MHEISNGDTAFLVCHLNCHVHIQVAGVMQLNIEKVLERNEKLSQLMDKADALESLAVQFSASARLPMRTTKVYILIIKNNNNNNHFLYFLSFPKLRMIKAFPFIIITAAIRKSSQSFRFIEACNFPHNNLSALRL